MNETLTRVLLEEEISRIEWLLLESKHGSRESELTPQELERVLRNIRQALVEIRISL